MTDMNRRSFLKALFGTLAVAPLAAQAAPTKKKPPVHPKGSLGIERGSLKKKARLIVPQQKTQSPAPTPQKVPTKPAVKPTPSQINALAELYRPLCEKLEQNMHFCYNDKGEATIGCGVHFKGFSELDKLPAFKIIPKKGCSLNIQKISSTNWKDLAKLPEVEKIEQIKLEDIKLDKKESWGSKLPRPKTEVLDANKPLFWIPDSTLKTANTCAARSFVEKAYEHHPDLAQLPPSVRLVVVDLIYNVGGAGYNFPNFKTAFRQRNYANMKEQCTTKDNPRRNAVRQWLIESARLANTGLSEEKIKQALRKGVCIKMSPRCEAGLWSEVDRCTRENCNWKKLQIAQARQSIQSLRS